MLTTPNVDIAPRIAVIFALVLGTRTTARDSFLKHAMQKNVSY